MDHVDWSDRADAYVRMIEAMDKFGLTVGEIEKLTEAVSVLDTAAPVLAVHLNQRETAE